MNFKYVHEDDQKTFWDFWNAMMRDMCKNPPEFLYHYTNSAGITGILNDGKMFATDATYTNDQQELQASIGHFYVGVLRAREEAEQGSPLYRALDKLQSGLLRDLHRPRGVYVISFSTEPNDNAQWGMYGGGEGGFNLAFRLSSLANIVLDKQYWLLRCTYDAKQHEGIIAKALAFITTLFAASAARFPNIDADVVAEDVVNWVMWMMVPLIPMLKGPSFAHEKEWRFAFAEPDFKKVEYESRRTVIRPRTRLDLRAPDGGRTMPALSGLMVGPSPHRELSVDALKGLLITLGYPTKVDGEPVIPVAMSDSSLRIV